MSENIQFNIKADTQQAQTGVGNLTSQIDRFNQALGEVDKATRRIFANLADLSARFQQQGFLGQQHQQTMERSLRQWEQTSKVLELSRRGAEARYAAAQGPARGQAAATLNQIERQQGAMFTLQRHVENLAMPVPGTTNVWPSAQHVPLTPLQRAHATLGVPPSAATQRATQRATQQAAQALQHAQLVSILGQPTPLQQAWMSLQQPHGPAQQQARLQAQQTARQMQQAQLISILGQTPTPLQLAHHQLSTFATPLQIAHGYQHSLGAAQAQQGLQNAQLISLFAQMGAPPGPGAPLPLGPPTGPSSRWPGTWGQQAMGYMAYQAPGAMLEKAGGFMPTLARGAGRLGAVAAGYGVYQAISTAMEAYETRARGVLSIGTMLDEQYGEVGTTLDDLRDKYHVLGRDGIAAMTALGRATGQFRNVGTTTRFARAYGMAPEEAATLAGTLTLMTGNLDPNLSAIAAVQRQSVAGGFRTLPVAPFAEEVARTAAVGGTAFAPLQVEDYARYNALMTSFGPRYGAAPSQAYGEYAQGLGTPAGNPAMDAVRRQALSRLAARQPVVMLGNRPLHIRDNYADYQIALENAGQIKEVQQEYYMEARRQGGGNPGLTRFWYQGLYGTQNALQAAEQFEAMEKTGGPAGTLARPIPPGEAAEAGRVGRAQQLEEYDVLRRAINLEELARTDGIKALEKWRTEILDSVGAVSKAYNENRGAVDMATEGLKKLSGELITLFGIAVSLRYPGLGAAITGAGVVKGLGEVGAGGGVPIEDILPPGHWALPPRPDPAATQPRKEQ